MLTNAGRLRLADIFAGDLPGFSYQFGLYTNAVVWTRDTVYSDLVVPSWCAPVGGYSLIPPATINPAGYGTVRTNDPVLFHNTDAVGHYAIGFWWSEDPSILVYGGAAFDTPIYFSSALDESLGLGSGDTLIVFNLITSRVNGP